MSRRLLDPNLDHGPNRQMYPEMLLGMMVQHHPSFPESAEVPLQHQQRRLELGAKDWGAGVDMLLSGHARAIANLRDEAFMGMFDRVQADQLAAYFTNYELAVKSSVSSVCVSYLDEPRWGAM